MIDTAFLLLLPHLQNPSIPTLWLADENALHTLQALNNNDNTLLHIATNRYDIYCLALEKNISTEFNDFTLEQLPFSPQKIVYRISKEKPLTHYLFNQAASLLNNNGELLIAGKKQEGIKSYGDNLQNTFQCDGKLKKTGNDYYASFHSFDASQKMDDQNYTELQQPFLQHERLPTLYSKPGVFGWNKIDKGTELLLQCLPDILEQYPIALQQILDLGCGYGWIFANLADSLRMLSPELAKSIHITATDNNAAAIRCALKNSENTPETITVLASDCANTITEKFDLILCNPPFHQGFSHDKQLTEKFLHQTKQHLKKDGYAVFVVNEFISLSQSQQVQFTHCETVHKANGFKVIVLH
jgi:16S rRNA (guanine1207-N2)-methyltransferase